MSGVKYRIGSEKLSGSPLMPYSAEALAFCAELSAMLMKSQSLRRYPDISALAFWCRKGNLQRLKENCPESQQRLGRGLCFHIAPGNIPINFAFSYLFGLLAGCANLVRLPSREFPQTEPVLHALQETLLKHPEIEKRTAFVQYSANNEITAQFCAHADARLIWGGDETIASVRGLPVKPRCVDICFADRYSICILNGQAILEADNPSLSRLAENFYNDTYLMDQNACSSPQLILWQQDSEAARKRFWDAVYDFAQKRYFLQAAVSVDKYTHMCEDAVGLTALEKVERQGNLVYRAQLSKLEGDLTRLRGKGGYFYECAMDELKELAPHITEKYQTVTYFGLVPDEVRECVTANRLRGIDRIVPVGKAMDIGIIWDGFDLVRMLSRLISVE